MIVDNMTDTDIFNFYDENWQDYDEVMDFLHTLLEHHKDELEYAKNNSKGTSVDSEKEIADLKRLLIECQDKLDEETHKNLLL